MEDIKNKEFDRHIEKMMNESSVAPPYGAWNRIATELAKNPGAAPVARAVPGGSWVSLIVGVAVVSASLLTAYILSSTKVNESQKVTHIEVASPPVKVATATLNNTTEMPVEEVATKVNREVIRHQATSVSIPGAVAVTEEPIMASRTVEMPLPEKAVALTDFIPVIDPVTDINSSKEEAKSLSLSTKPKVDEEDDDIESDMKVNMYGDKKLKFKPQRKKGFKYPKFKGRRR